MTPGMARSEADALLLAAGDTVLKYERALHAEHVDALRVNGLEFKVASGSATDPLGVVLDRFQTVCQDENADLRSGVEMLGKRTRSEVPFAGTLRAERDGRGAVACLGRNWNSSVQGRTLVARLHGFLPAADVAAIGPLRLFFVSQAAGHTTYVVLSSEGSFPLLRAFPREGDAPGRDPDGVPRPAAVVRRLSAWAPGASASVVVYEATNAEPHAALVAYRSALSAAGFEISPRSTSEEYVLARHGTRAVLASVTRTGEEGAFLTVVVL
jgi:hypothetical protein